MADVCWAGSDGITDTVALQRRLPIAGQLNVVRVSDADALHFVFTWSLISRKDVRIKARAKLQNICSDCLDVRIDNAAT